MPLREELAPIQASIAALNLPRGLEQLFGDSYDCDRHEFTAQESVIHDYKADAPSDFTTPYGASIVRLALSFYNTFGGLIIFGIDDITHTPSAEPVRFDIEAFNRMLSDFTGHDIECICRAYRVLRDGQEVDILAVLVPQRVLAQPAALKNKLDKYPVGTMFVRVRHEVLIARPSHYPLLFSRRTSYGDQVESAPTSIQKVLPPPFVTMRSFVGRDGLLKDLWGWVTTGTDPRRYLYGPGGSGKSTLAYEFASSITSAFGAVNIAGAKSVDYILYLSAKETEFNVLVGKVQPFAVRNFTNSTEQQREILYHSGYVSENELNELSTEIYIEKLEELFSTFNGIIVLDDIDALSRAGKDTGEEQLFIAAIKNGGSTRILYTQRHASQSALNSSTKVPGLDFASEYCEFIETYCAQLGVATPNAAELVDIFKETDGLPLLVELVIGLRRHFSSYVDVLNKINETGGETIRDYLYSREYDRIRSDRTKLMLALLSIVDTPLDASSIEKLLSASSDQVRDAIGEVSAIFVQVRKSSSGDVVYGLVDPARPFITSKNSELKFFSQLDRKVRIFARGGAVATADEQALISQLFELVRTRRWDEIVLVGDSIAAEDIRLVNPQVRSFLGQGYAAANEIQAEKAREHFRAAEGMGAKDIHLIRSWYFLEYNIGKFQEARRICRKVMSDDTYAVQVVVEFTSRLATTYYQHARELRGSSPERAQSYLIKSIVAYNDAIAKARGAYSVDIDQMFNWLDRSLRVFFRYLMNSPEDAYNLVIEAVNSKIDYDDDVLQQIAYFLGALTDSLKYNRRILKGLSHRYSAKLAQTSNVATKYPNAVGLMNEIHAKFEDLS